MIIPFVLMLLLIPFTANLAIIVIFKSCIPLLGASYIPFSYSTYFFRKYRLLNEKYDIEPYSGIEENKADQENVIELSA